MSEIVVFGDPPWVKILLTGAFIFMLSVWLLIKVDDDDDDFAS